MRRILRFTIPPTFNDSTKDPDFGNLGCNAALKNPIHVLWSCLELDIVWSDMGSWDKIGLCPFQAR